MNKTVKQQVKSLEVIVKLMLANQHGGNVSLIFLNLTALSTCWNRFDGFVLVVLLFFFLLITVHNARINSKMGVNASRLELSLC